MTKRTHIASLLLLAMIVAAPAGADTPATAPRPACQPAGPSSAPATPDDVSPDALAVLQRLEQAGDTYTTLTADVVYKVEQRLTGDVEIRTGEVAYQQKTADQPARFRIDFQTLQLGEKGRVTNQPLQYLFDGNWLTIAKHNIKQLTRIQVAAEGEQVEALRIGKGPFPVPFGQKTADIIGLCEVTTLQPGPDAPNHTDVLQLVPRKDHKDQMNFVRLRMWIDRKSNLPVKITSRDKSKNVTTVSFDDIQTRDRIAADLFTMETPPGWDVTYERLGE